MRNPLVVIPGYYGSKLEETTSGSLVFLAAAGTTVSDLLPGTLPVDSCLIYGTRRRTTASCQAAPLPLPPRHPHGPVRRSLRPAANPDPDPAAAAAAGPVPVRPLRARADLRAPQRQPLRRGGPGPGGPGHLGSDRDPDPPGHDDPGPRGPGGRPAARLRPPRPDTRPRGEHPLSGDGAGARRHRAVAHRRPPGLDPLLRRAEIPARECVILIS